MWVTRRKNDRVKIDVKYVEEEVTTATDYMTKDGTAFNTTPDNKFLTFNVNLQQLKDKQAVHGWLVQRLAPRHLLPTKA